MSTLRADVQIAVVEVGEPARDVEPEACATADRLGGEERVEDPMQFRWSATMFPDYSVTYVPGPYQMKEYVTASTIAASQERVWAVLADGEGYQEWNPEIIAVRGQFALGARIVARAAAPSERHRCRAGLDPTEL